MSVWTTLVDCCEESASAGRRNSAETIMGLSTSGPFDSAIGMMLRGLASYADAHKGRFGSDLADDYVLGKSWSESLQGALALLNGETGRLDCGDVDRAIRAMATAAGFNGDSL